MITTGTYKDRSVISNPGDLPTCCGLQPTVHTWKRLELKSYCCNNPQCKNADGVLMGLFDGDSKWERWRVKQAQAEQEDE